MSFVFELTVCVNCEVCIGVPAVPPAVGRQAEGGPVRRGQAQPVQAGHHQSSP